MTRLEILEAENARLREELSEAWEALKAIGVIVRTPPRSIADETVVGIIVALEESSHVT